MKTLTRQQAIDELTEREYDIFKRLILSESKNTIMPLLKEGIGGFNRESNEKLVSDYWILYDEEVTIK